MKKLISTLLAVLMLSCCVMSAMAAGSITTVAPSIGAVAPSIGAVAPSIGEIAVIGADVEIYISAVNAEDYSGAVAEMAAKAADAASVADIFAGVDAKGEDLSAMHAVTTMMDFKYVADNTVVPCDGMFDAPVAFDVEGSELTMGSSIEELVILQLNADATEVNVLSLTSYDAETGAFSVEFPCFGAFIIATRG